ncbi:cytochrome P450 52A12 [Yamadazyma tenuis ATCC 10573]|uniref:Cytochrome P450 52A12 n=1 Tax=Candida tenuis (strain ATCC 10573 / BCRC 21748 / CBS 615 / JCM 9827 / NBRC 10315 / NRRL Y-1498 / VKM Y-70) TaxID=590646 RepID=G3BEU9_CANTC|nr:cytochrome P450 52A12 [Yamadazyma tenuis ATCC 10573]EGV60598.1 cytochrome P450 52A12 [Yamadazyma tenuis ATCC 10573]
MPTTEEVQAKISAFSTSWVGLLIAVLVVYKIAYTVQNMILAKKMGCKAPTTFLQDYALGFRNVGEMLKNKKSGFLNNFTLQRFNQFGDTISLRVAGNVMFITREPENIKAILGTQFNDFDLGIRYKQFLPLLGDGIFTLDHKGWKNSRAMLRPQFAREQVAHVKMLEPHVQNLFAHIRKYQGQVFDIQTYFFKLTMDSATEFLFGESVESLRDESINMVPTGECDVGLKTRFADSFNDAQTVLATRAMLQQLYFLVNTTRFKEACKDVHGLTDFFVHQALNTSPDELEKKSKGGYIFLFELVKQTRDPKILRDQALNILLAGRDTTAGLLSFTFFELARNPQMFDKLKEEIHATFGAGAESRIDDITFESLKKCEYLKAVINEALRMYPSVPQNFRITNKNTTLPRGGGPDGLSPIFIPRHSTVAYSVYATHRHERFYGKDAEVFRPERWFDEGTKKLGWAFLPFNGGPRICLGQQFALTEASYVVARIVQEFSSLKSFDEQYPPKLNSQLTVNLEDGCHITLT